MHGGARCGAHLELESAAGFALPSLITLSLSIPCLGYDLFIMIDVLAISVQLVHYDLRDFGCSRQPPEFVQIHVAHSQYSPTPQHVPTPPSTLAVAVAPAAVLSAVSAMYRPNVSPQRAQV